jgi:hypothetical protein
MNNLSNWKHDFLDFESTIGTFEVQLIEYLDKFPEEGNVIRLLRFHLAKTRELLWAEINGGLDEQYQYEVDNIPTKGSFW